MPKVYRVSDIDEAIELASEFRDKGIYDWFRGQVRSDWLPHSSLFRLHLKHRDDWGEKYYQKFIRFWDWIKNTQGLEEICNDTNAIFAVAQHYGLPTSYLDFSTDPAVAGFFAADTDSPEIGIESCIFCLDSSDLIRTWHILHKALDPEKKGVFPIIECIRVDVANLWRLQSQAGVFLYVPTNWEVHYPMDRILFPYNGYPSCPSKRDMYPDRKSQLEILIDQFFDNERKVESHIRMHKHFDSIGKETNKAVFYEIGKRPEYLSEYIKIGELEPHISWELSSKWLTLIEENYSDIIRREIPISLDFSAKPMDIANRFINGIKRLIKKDKSLRKSSVIWKFETQSNIVFRSSLENGLIRLWDGLRNLPYDDIEIAQSLGNWLSLYLLDFDNQCIVTDMLNISSKLFGPSICIEFGSSDGASSQGYVSIDALHSALRPDLPAIISEEYIEYINDMRFLLQIIISPKMLFDFRKLANLFATQIAPTQMIRTSAIFYNPARLNILGLP